MFDAKQAPPHENAYHEGLISKGDLAVWLGREKHRKTNLLLQFGICAATGRDFLHFRFIPTKPLKVVVVDFETKSSSLYQRYQAICEAMELTEEEKQLLNRNLRIVEARKLVRKARPLPRFPDGKPAGKRHDPAAEEFWQQFPQQFTADIYIFDPMRSLHGADENDSAIESLLSKLRQVFREAVVVIAHHMRKQHVGGRLIRLEEDARLWSDAARGSSAIKAHADVIVCQERSTDRHGNELLAFGAFLKDGADVEPIHLEESGHESFFWRIRANVPTHLRLSFDVLNAAKRSLKKHAAVRLLRRHGIK